MKLVKCLFTIFLCILALSPVPSAVAQDGNGLVCAPEDVQTVLDDALAALTAAQSASMDDQYSAIVETRAMLATLDSRCLGLDFEGTAEIVTDSVYIPAGIYRVTVTTEGYFIMHETVLSGSCKFSRLGLNVSAGDATQGAQALFNSDGCTLLWEISNVTAPYTVSFEKMN